MWELHQKSTQLTGLPCQEAFPPSRRWPGGRQAGQSELLGVSMRPVASVHCSLGPAAPQLGFLWAPNHGSTLHLGTHSPLRRPRHTLTFRHAFRAEVSRVQSNPRGPRILPAPHCSYVAPAGGACHLWRRPSPTLTSWLTSSKACQWTLCLMLSFLLGIVQRGEEDPRELAMTGSGVEASAQGCMAHPARRSHQLDACSVCRCVGRCPLGEGGRREAGPREVLTHEVRQQDDQRGGEHKGAQGRTLPVTVLGGLLEAEGRPGEGAAGQGPGRGGVHRAGRQRVPWRRGAEERRGASRLEEEVPVDGEKPEGVRVCGLPGTQSHLEDRGGSRSMQRSLETVATEKTGQTERRRITYRTTQQGTRTHASTEHGWDSPTHGEPPHPTRARAGGVSNPTEGWLWRPLSWEGMGLRCCFLGITRAVL